MVTELFFLGSKEAGLSTNGKGTMLWFLALGNMDPFKNKTDWVAN